MNSREEKIDLIREMIKSLSFCNGLCSAWYLNTHRFDPDDWEGVEKGMLKELPMLLDYKPKYSIAYWFDRYNKEIRIRILNEILTEDLDAEPYVPHS